MAIIANININGLQVDNAYVKVQDISGSKIYDYAVIYDVFSDKESSADPENSLCEIVVVYNYTNGYHIYQQAYEVLKREDMIVHIRSVANIDSIKNFHILQTLKYIGDA